MPVLPLGTLENKAASLHHPPRCHVTCDGIAVQPVTVERGEREEDQEGAGQGAVTSFPVGIVELVTDQERSRAVIDRQKCALPDKVPGALHSYREQMVIRRSSLRKRCLHLLDQGEEIGAGGLFCVRPEEHPPADRRLREHPGYVGEVVLGTVGEPQIPADPALLHVSIFALSLYRRRAFCDEEGIPAEEREPEHRWNANEYRLSRKSALDDFASVDTLLRGTGNEMF